MAASKANPSTLLTRTRAQAALLFWERFPRRLPGHFLLTRFGNFDQLSQRTRIDCCRPNCAAMLRENTKQKSTLFSLHSAPPPGRPPERSPKVYIWRIFARHKPYRLLCHSRKILELRLKPAEPMILPPGMVNCKRICAKTSQAAGPRYRWPPNTAFRNAGLVKSVYATLCWACHAPLEIRLCRC